MKKTKFLLLLLMNNIFLKMYLFLSCLVAFSVKGVDLWDGIEFEADQRAIDTARLINLVNNADGFKVLYISRPNDAKRKEDEYDTGVLEAMKLLQKTFDTYRKSNVFIDGTNIQYISNPEVLEDYRNLPKEHSEVQDIITGEVSTERSSVEVPDEGSEISSQREKKFRRPFRRRFVNKEETNLDTSSFEVNDAAERIVADYIRRNMGIEHYLPQDSKETKRFILRSKHQASGPIMEPDLNTYKVKVSLQNGGEPKAKNNLNVSNKEILSKENLKKKSKNKNETKRKKNSKKNWSSEDKKEVVEKRFKNTSKAKDILMSSNKKSGLNKNILKGQVRQEKNNTLSNVKNSKVRTRPKIHKVNNTETKDKNKRNFVPNKAENKVLVNEHGPNWENDDKNKRKPELEKEDDLYNKPYNAKKENTDESYEGDERPKQESNDLNKKQDNTNKKYDDRDTIPSNKNKKVNKWNKRDDSWDKMNDNWDTKDHSQSKERNWNKKDYNNKNKKEDTDDMKNDYKIKVHRELDNPTTVTTENSGWGNYALFKNFQNKKKSMEKENIEEEKIKPKVHITALKSSSYESRAPQSDDYQKPKRNFRTYNRTPIPMIGKRPVYD